LALSFLEASVIAAKMEYAHLVSARSSALTMAGFAQLKFITNIEIRATVPTETKVVPTGAIQFESQLALRGEDHFFWKRFAIRVLAGQQKRDLAILSPKQEVSSLQYMHEILELVKSYI
jgi:hypothetical protein